MKLWAGSFCRLGVAVDGCDCRAAGAAPQVKEQWLYRALEEDGELQKRVEGWKEGLEEQSVAHGVRGASLH